MNPLIAKAVETARKVAEMTLVGATETDAVTDAMEVVDMLDVRDGDGRLVGWVNILCDQEECTFCVMPCERDLPDQDDADALREELIGALVLRFSMLFELCETVSEAGALWAALSSNASSLARSRIRDLGGDPDAVMESLDRFFLLNPDL